MRVYLISFILVLAASIATAQGGPGVGENTLWFTISDTNTTATASQAQGYGCYNQESQANALTFPFTFVCTVPAGWSYRVHTFTAWLNESMSTNERCLFDVASSIGTAAAWSLITAGFGTMSTCDRGDLVAFETAGEYCIKTDSVGSTFELGSTPSFFIRIREESLNNCDSITSMTFSIEFDATRIATP